MKNTGIIRKIDDLGRIVIPKEIRKNLKIHIGDNIEIYIEDNSKNIVLKKSESLCEFREIAKSITESIYEQYGCNAIVTNRDSIVATNNNISNIYIKKNISKELYNIIERRENIVKFESIDILEKERENNKMCISTIISDSDAIGAIVIFEKNGSEEEEKRISKETKFLANIIGKYME